MTKGQVRAGVFDIYLLSIRIMVEQNGILEVVLLIPVADENQELVSEQEQDNILKERSIVILKAHLLLSHRERKLQEKIDVFEDN